MEKTCVLGVPIPCKTGAPALVLHVRILTLLFQYERVPPFTNRMRVYRRWVGDVTRLALGFHSSTNKRVQGGGSGSKRVRRKVNLTKNVQWSSSRPTFYGEKEYDTDDVPLRVWVGSKSRMFWSGLRRSDGISRSVRPYHFDRSIFGTSLLFTEVEVRHHLK